MTLAERPVTKTQSRALDALILVAVAETFALNALSGGYCREVTRSGQLTEQAIEGPYRTLMEGIESFASLTKAIAQRLEKLGMLDTVGRDLLARTLFGGRVSLTVGLLATLVALVIGVSVGAIAGYLGGKVDLITQRFVEHFAERIVAEQRND